MQILKQSSIKGLFLPAIALCSLLLSGNAAHAELVTYSFTGGVSQVNGPLVSSAEFNNTSSSGSNVVTNMTLTISDPDPMPLSSYMSSLFQARMR